jgi:hypothetical protein
MLLAERMLTSTLIQQFHGVERNPSGNLYDQGIKRGRPIGGLGGNSPCTGAREVLDHELPEHVLPPWPPPGSVLRPL